MTFTIELKDLFYYDPSWRIIVCKQCAVVPQTNIAWHIRRHRSATRAFKVASIKLFERSLDYPPLIRDAYEMNRNVRPLPIAYPIRFLDVFHNGICYLLYKDDQDRRRGEARGIKGLTQAGLVRTLIAY
ncbi:Vegetative incompatibility protein HET-E-1 [Fusarium oxysporum f. sp. albedinis]|nr:Vegetative incompatibility protein HET-E-1 [Fusarium oxysporum f. sp. albedinis]